MNKNRLIMGTSLTLAAFAVAIDHTRHQLPEAAAPQQQEAGMMIDEGSPCSLSSPCSLDGGSPCALEGGLSPCSL